MWCGEVQCGMVWYGMVWYDVQGCGVMTVICCGEVRLGVVCCDMM